MSRVIAHVSTAVLLGACFVQGMGSAVGAEPTVPRHFEGDLVSWCFEFATPSATMAFDLDGLEEVDPVDLDVVVEFNWDDAITTNGRGTDHYRAVSCTYFFEDGEAYRAEDFSVGNRYIPSGYTIEFINQIDRFTETADGLPVGGAAHMQILAEQGFGPDFCQIDPEGSIKGVILAD